MMFGCTKATENRAKGTIKITKKEVKKIEVHKIKWRKGMSFDKGQFRGFVENVLKEFDVVPYSKTASEIIMLTCAQESLLGKYIRQNKGPARGVVQIEPNTEKDVWINFIEYRPEIKAKIIEMTGVTSYGNKLALEGNLVYQVILARLVYYRKPQPLPYNNIEDMAYYYKVHYNTILGKAKVEDAIKNYENYCL